MQHKNGGCDDPNTFFAHDAWTSTSSVMEFTARLPLRGCVDEYAARICEDGFIKSGFRKGGLLPLETR